MPAATSMHAGSGRAEGIGPECAENKPQMELELGVYRSSPCRVVGVATPQPKRQKAEAGKKTR